MRLLVVSYFFPPMPSVGGNRWEAAARWLRRLGHEVTVVTTGAYGAPGGEEGVVRVADLGASPALRRVLRRPPLPAPGAAVADVPPPRVLTHVLVPDAQVVSWAPAALRAVRRLVREWRPDVLVTSSPFESAHLVGLALGRGRPPWVAELRDGWTFEPLRPDFPTGVQRRADLALERHVVRTADVVVAATEPIAADLRARMGVPARTVPTGWDPDLDAAAAAAVPPTLPADRFSVVHTGTLSGGWGRDPGPLLDAFVRARAEEPRLQLVLAGRLSPADEVAIASRDLRDGVRRVGLLPRAESLALQRAAGALVLVTSPNPSEATGKLFEYLASGRPIVAIAAGNEAGRIVTATRTGVAVAHQDVEEIARALVRAARGDLPYAPRGLEAYIQPGPAKGLLAAATEAVAQRSDRSTPGSPS